MYENLWLVNKAAYDTCSVNVTAGSRKLLTCDTPTQLKFTSVIFAQFVAEDDGLQFEGGKHYYFIATSDGTESGLNNTENGNCRKRNMRMKVYVCRKGIKCRKHRHGKCHLGTHCKPASITSATELVASATDPATYATDLVASATYATDPVTYATDLDRVASATDPAEYELPHSLPVELVWYIDYNQTLAWYLSEKSDHYRVVAVCKAPNSTITRLDHEGGFVSSWTCQKPGQRFVILEPKSKTNNLNVDDTYFEVLFDNNLLVRESNTLNSSFTIKVDKFKNFVNEANRFNDGSSFAFLISMYLFVNTF
ncbi:hypothetical protein GZ77_11210 [Endozoicomonas montiporae]|uniref:Ephrin RBD domain-containing protein n=2 Tax=Endozoicomonas montiporae TaxID=1027273 RepID=A0A081N8R2_9GAMM|nr:hypothetical protein GZ77_11210 [Endozoicomonas montiporae]